MTQERPAEPPAPELPPGARREGGIIYYGKYAKERSPLVTGLAALIGAGLVFFLLYEAGERRAAKPAPPPQLAGTYSARETVRSLLKDPDAANFRRVAPSSKAKYQATVVCGDVNAKNGFGAFIGYQGFIAIPARREAFLEEETPPAEWRSLVAEFC